MPKISFRELTKDDDAAVARDMRAVTVPGAIEIAFDHHPSFYDSVQVRGETNQVLAAIDNETGKLCGLAVRSERDVYLNGEIRRGGYLSNLRINPSARNGWILARGYEQLKALHRAGQAELYTSTIISGNAYAESLLTSGRCQLPAYHRCGGYYTAAISLNGKRRCLLLPADVKIRRGTAEWLEPIVACLNRNGRRKQFYPVYHQGDFAGEKAIRGMSVENFYLAEQGGEVLAVIACWDQSSFKQLRVMSYQGRMKFLRPLYNLCSGAFKTAPLPKPGSTLNHFLVGFIAIDHDDFELFTALLTAAYNDYSRSGFHYFAVGLHNEDPLLEAVKAFPHTPYLAEMFVVNWPEQQQAFNELDKERVPYLEAGAL